MRRSVLTIFALVMLLPTIAFARLESSGRFSIAWPQGDFSKYVERAYGATGRAGWSFGGQSSVKAVLFGDISFLNYGSTRRVEPFSTTIPNVFVDVITENYMMLLCPGISVCAARGPVRPYGELFGGLTIIATTTNIENRGSFNDEVIASSNDLTDVTANIGFGAGVKVLVWRRSDVEDYRELREVLINIGVSYIKGGEAEYLKEGSIRRHNNDVVYDVYKSGTDMTRLTIGAAFNF